MSKKVLIRFPHLKQPVRLEAESVDTSGISALVLRRSDTTKTIVPYSAFLYVDVEEIEDGNG